MGTDRVLVEVGRSPTSINTTWEGNSKASFCDRAVVCLQFLWLVHSEVCFLRKVRCWLLIHNMANPRRPYKVLDRTRSLKKGVMAANLDELLEKSRTKLGYDKDKQLLAVLEEDGTEVEEDDYFQTLENNTTLMLLYAGERWSPFSSPDAVDSAVGGGDNMARLLCLLTRLETEPGCIALMGETDLELLAEMETNSLPPTFPRFDQRFLEHLQAAADRHLLEKGQIRDTLGLLRIYQKSATRPGGSGDEHEEKRKRARKGNK